MEKKCFKCCHVKPLSEFYRHSEMKDGTINKCKECAKRDGRVNRVHRVDYYLRYDRARFQCADRRVAHAASCKRQKDASPEKSAARYAVSNAVRAGRIKKLPCELCGSLKVEAHHTDYSKPLDVQWLCFRHHREKHGNQFFSV